MITTGIVVNDLETFDKIISFAERKKEYLVNFYNEEYAKIVDTLSEYAFRFRENLSKKDFSQNVMYFSLRTMLIFKTILYLYLKQNNPTISNKEMEFITSMLNRLDEWIYEEMNTEEYYMRGAMYYKPTSYLKPDYWD